MWAQQGCRMYAAAGQRSVRVGSMRNVLTRGRTSYLRRASCVAAVRSVPAAWRASHMAKGARISYLAQSASKSASRGALPPPL